MNPLRCVCYARYSTDRQNPLSIEDQVRKSHEYADRCGWRVLQEETYSDEALAGDTDDRPGLRHLLEAAASLPRTFDVILIEDTSRLSRDLGDSLRITKQLKFDGVRVVFVSQGIDSDSEQFEVLLAVHGLVDGLYIKELAQKTHRGLEGKILRGLHAGGRCFGYKTAAVEGGKKLEVNEAEAALVRRIFEMSASGGSLKAIAKTLNREGVPPPRPRAGKQYGSWCPTAIQAMLRRELYIGRIVWNRSRFLKAPGSNKRLRRARPQSEWRVVERPELRIISAELWQRVQSRLAWVKQRWGRGQGAGLQNRAASSPYLLSGFLKCGDCGANLVIVTGRSGGAHPKYGCPQNFYRGTCANKLKERQDWLEERLLAELQNAVLQPEAVSYAIEEFGRQLKAALANLSGELAGMRKRKEELEEKIRRIARKITEGHDSPPMMAELTGLENELAGITDRLLSEGPGSVEAHLAEIRQFVAERLQNLPELLAGDVPQARAELAKHVDQIRMVPRQVGGACYYRAVGQWDLLGGYGGRDRNREFPEVRVRMVAGAGFEPATFGL